MKRRSIDTVLDKASDLGWNQVELASRLHVAPQFITNWIKRGMPADRLEGAADALGCSIDELLGRKVSHLPPAPQSDNVRFDQLDVRAACGDGYSNEDHPEVVSTMFLPAQVAQEMLGTTNRNGNIKLITAAKDSMAPTINPDDLVFVDTAVNEYVGETVYLILHGNELLCKRLSLVGRDIVVSSDNKSYPDWKWSERPDATKIIGRVVRVLPIQFKKFGVDR
ncbi:MAG TPA: hypothetical protein DD803_04320 [Alcaligenes faecalis]|nr:hypothetical protein [Alcaligenes faecalis]